MSRQRMRRPRPTEPATVTHRSAPRFVEMEAERLEAEAVQLEKEAAALRVRAAEVRSRLVGYRWERRA